MTPLQILAFVGLFVGLTVVGAAIFLVWQMMRASQNTRAADPGLQLMQQQLEGLRSQLAETLSGQTQNVNQQLHQVTTQVSQRLENISSQMMTSQKSVGERLDNAARVVSEVQKSLGTLGQAAERIFDVGKDIAGLQEILRAPKMRGGLGEFFLGDLLSQILPTRHYELQHAFKNGGVVDAVVRLGGKLVPVDAKFPLENFRKVMDAKTDEERKPLKKKLAGDVKKHIDDIADKYILPDEDTYDFALMYVPAENVYYEIIVKDEDSEEGKSLAEYALKRRVIPVSPNSFYAYLQAIILGLRGFEIEENAKVIMENLARLQGDFHRFREDFDVLGGHVSKVKGKYDDAEKRLERFQEKLASIGHSTPDLPASSTPALPPKS
ncbi:MAG TPA: DNA recombination protein RmuC [Elusimicrobiota bacterium]|nr:DNA recombination protein RmuC [Elusimicrobiota bacterium]